MIAVVDGPVIWHVQTTGFDTGILTGAWITEENSAGETNAGENSTETPNTAEPKTPEQQNLLTNATRITHPGDGLVEELARNIEDALDTYRELDPKSRWEPLNVPDYREVRATFKGEEQVADAWAWATVLAGLVEQWAALEAKRRARKKLAEEFGSESREIPGL